MTEIQLIILGSIVILTILSTVVGIQVSFIFRDLKKVIDRMDKVLTNLQMISSSLGQSLEKQPIGNGLKVEKKNESERLTPKLHEKPIPLVRKRFFKRKS